MVGADGMILEGDCRTVLAGLPERSVQTCVTSPPYFGLRDYGTDGQIGLEPTPDEFVAALVAVFREVRRVLRDDGTVWLNLGDSYAANRTYQVPDNKHRDVGNNMGMRVPAASDGIERPDGLTPAPALAPGCKPKDLLGVPWMVAFALRADGWYLRSDIIWSKPNPMPESVTDRPTKAHEYLFLLSKGPRYFYDADAVRETSAQPYEPTPVDERPDWGKPNRGLDLDGNAFRGINLGDGTSRNKRSVWTVATAPFAGAHFATFPPKLIEPCILAGSPPKCCGVCGAPWRRVVERTAMVVRPTPKREAWQAEDDHARTQTGGTMVEPPTSRTVGWESTCTHQDDTGSSVILDPFAGSGTVGVVCGWHGREHVGIELNPEYAEMARARIALEGRPGGRPAHHEPAAVVAEQLGLL
jgi:DNA modification methylase